MTHDLLAALVEVTSVGVAGKALKKPVVIERPKPPVKRFEERTETEQRASVKKGIGILRATARKVRGG